MSKFSKWAKYGVFAMVVADGVGIMIAKDRLDQPAADLSPIAQTMPVAMSDTATALPQDGAQATGTLALNDPQALPAVSRIDPLPAPIRIEPLVLDAPEASPEVARVMKMALRAPVIPTVRIAELRSAHKATRLFSSAFASDISAPTQAGGVEPDADFARVREAREAIRQSGATYGETGTGQPTAPTESLDTPVQAQSAIPVPEFGGEAKVQAPQPDSQPAPAAPEAGAPSDSEIPAS